MATREFKYEHKSRTPGYYVSRLTFNDSSSRFLKNQYKNKSCTEKVMNLGMSHFKKPLRVTKDNVRRTEKEAYNGKYRPNVRYIAATGVNNCWYKVTKSLWLKCGINTPARAREIMKIPSTCKPFFSDIVCFIAFELGTKVDADDCQDGISRHVHLFPFRGVSCPNCVRFTLTTDHVAIDPSGPHVLCGGRNYMNMFDKAVGTEKREISVINHGITGTRDLPNGAATVAYEVKREKPDASFALRQRDNFYKAVPVVTQVITFDEKEIQEKKVAFNLRKGMTVNTNTFNDVRAAAIKQENREALMSEPAGTTTRKIINVSDDSIFAAVEKRNLEPPSYSDVNVTEDSIEMQAGEFIATYCEKAVLSEMSKTLIEPSGEYNNQWMKKKNRNLKRYKGKVAWLINPKKYTLSLKSKVKSSIYEPHKEQKGQTIHEQNKLICAEYSSIFK